MASRTSNLDPAFERALRDVIFDHPLPCPHCRYDLRGVPGSICPECGRNVSLDLRIADLSPRRVQRERIERIRCAVRRTANTLVLVGAFLAIAAFLIFV
jgi:hypothetical protein